MDVDLSLENTFELEVVDGLVGRGCLVDSDYPPISAGELKKHADKYGYDFHVFGQDSYFVSQVGKFKGEYGRSIEWRMAYGVEKTNIGDYLVWLRYRPVDEGKNNNAVKPWLNIIQTLGGDVESV